MFDAGSTPGQGTFFCLGCGSQLSLRENDDLPECPRCHGVAFRRDSIFEPMQDHTTATTAAFDALAAQRPPDALERARDRLPGPGRYLVGLEAKEDARVFEIEPGWTRIGRSVNADIRLDDPSVSRRHALIVCEEPETMRVLDDRSLNGVFLNGKLIEWARLEDGDELTIGRYCLIALEA